MRGISIIFAGVLWLTALVSAQEVQDVCADPKLEHFDCTAIEPYQVDPSQLERFRADPDFAYDLHASIAQRTPTFDFWQWLTERLEGLLGPVDDGFLDTGLLIIAIVIVMLGVFFIARSGGRLPFSRSEKGGTVLMPDAHELASMDYAALCRSAESAGQYREALRYTYLHVLQLLDQAGLINYRPDKTNRAYRLELERTDLRDGFAQVTRAYERAWYGGYSVSRSQFEQQRSAAAALQEAQPAVAT
jgi:hypothetical protein